MEFLNASQHKKNLIKKGVLGRIVAHLISLDNNFARLKNLIKKGVLGRIVAHLISLDNNFARLIERKLDTAGAAA